MLLKFDLIYANPPKKFTNSAKEIADRLFENFIKMLEKNTIVEETKYFLPDEKETDMQINRNINRRKLQRPQPVTKNICHPQKFLC